jgi:HlyD family secretion protein
MSLSSFVKRKYVLLLLVLLGSVAALAWAVSGVSSLRVPEVDVVSPQTGPLEGVVIADGTLSYRTEVALTSEVLGTVDVIHVDEGDRVERGQLLVNLRAEQYEAQLAQRRAALQADIVALDAKAADRDLTAARLRRFSTLHQQLLVSADDLESARAEARRSDAGYRESVERIKAQRGLVAEAEDLLRRSSIRSPIAGTVLSIDIELGETAVPSTMSFNGSVVARIAETDSLVATARVGEYDVWRIRAGESARVIVPALEDAVLPGLVRVNSLAPVRASAQGGTVAAAAASYEVVVDIRAAQHTGLRTGMACRIEFIREGDSRKLTVPLDAVIPRTKAEASAGAAESGSVLVLEGGRVAVRDILLGPSNGQRREVLDGLRAQDVVILIPQGATPPAVGTRVKVSGRKSG